MTAPYAPFGTISHGTMRPEDLIPAFADALRTLAKRAGYAQEFSSVIEQADSVDFDNPDECDDALECLDDALQSFAPPYAYFGAHPGDGADYGFWLMEDWEQQARDDGALFVGDLSEIPKGFRGGSVVVINDHGNATLYKQSYRGARREVWSVV